MHMSAIKDGRYPVEIAGKTYHLLFSLNALDEIQDKFGGYDKLDEVFNQDNKDWIKNTKWLLALLINEGAEEGEPELTERQVGKMIHTGNIFEVQTAMMKAFSTGTTGSAEKTEEAEENVAAEAESNEEGNATGGQAN